MSPKPLVIKTRTETINVDGFMFTNSKAVIEFNLNLGPTGDRVDAEVIIPDQVLVLDPVNDKVVIEDVGYGRMRVFTIIPIESYGTGVSATQMFAKRI